MRRGNVQRNRNDGQGTLRFLSFPNSVWELGTAKLRFAAARSRHDLELAWENLLAGRPKRSFGIGRSQTEFGNEERGAEMTASGARVLVFILLFTPAVAAQQAPRIVTVAGTGKAGYAGDG